MRFIVRNCSGREHFMPYLKKHIPNLILAYDAHRVGAMENFRYALSLAENDSAIHLEDDIILTKGFIEKAQDAIKAMPDTPIQFFSMRKADLEVGSRLEPPRTFLMGQCFYLPKLMSKGLLAYSQKWPRLTEHPSGLDLMVADYFVAIKQKYFIKCPSLVDHRAGKSIIHPRRSSKRQSLTFEDAEYEGLV